MPNPYTPCGRATPPNGLTAVWGVARPQDGRPAAVFFPLGYPFLPGGHDQADAEWMVIRGPLKGAITIRPEGGRPPAGRQAGRGLAIVRAYLMFLITIN
jgi:hypothetical protein